MDDKTLLYIGVGVAALYALNKLDKGLSTFVTDTAEKGTALYENSTFSTTPLSVYNNESASPFSWANLGKLVTFVPWGVYSMWRDMDAWKQ